MSLRESEERYRLLAGALQTQVQFRTQELERRNADIVRQGLAQLAKDGKSDPEQLVDMIQDVEELVRGLTQEIRTSSYLLYPPMLDEGGLPYALRWYVEGLVECSGIEVELHIPDSFERLSRELELVIFRVVQECLTNVHRHSGSKDSLDPA